MALITPSYDLAGARMDKSTLAFIALCALDLITTYIGGTHNEANPIGQIIAMHYGLLGLATVKLVSIGQFFGSVALLKWMKCPLERYYKWMAIGAYVLLIAWNVFCILWNFK